MLSAVATATSNTNQIIPTGPIIVQSSVSNAALWAAVIGALSALIITIVKDYLFERLKERRVRQRSEAEVYRQYLAPLCEACEKVAWRSKEIFVDKRHAFLKTSTLPLDFNAYKRDSTLYRIATVIGWIRSMKLELSSLPRTSASFTAPISKEIAAFQSALADGPHVEIHRLTKLCAIWHIDISGLSAERQADLAMRFEVEVYAAAGDRLKSDPNSLRNLGENEKLQLCRRLSTYLSEQIGLRPEAVVLEGTVEQAIAGLSYREALLYRDWQDALGDAMIERDPDSSRRFRIIGYQKFTELLSSDTPAPWIKVLSKSIDDIDFDEVDPSDFRSQQLRDLAGAIASILIGVAATKDAALLDKACLGAATAIKETIAANVETAS